MLALLRSDTLRLQKRLVKADGGSIALNYMPMPSSDSASLEEPDRRLMNKRKKRLEGYIANLPLRPCVELPERLGNKESHDLGLDRYYTMLCGKLFLYTMHQN